MTEDEIGLVKRLVNTPMKELRIEAFDGGDQCPTQREADERFKGETKGELIEMILTQREDYND